MLRVVPSERGARIAEKHPHLGAAKSGHLQLSRSAEVALDQRNCIDAAQALTDIRSETPAEPSGRRCWPEMRHAAAR